MKRWPMIFVPLLVACLCFLLPGYAFTPEGPCTSGCIGCKNENVGGEWHHNTSSTKVLDGCVNEEKTDNHGNNQGCTSEPHENPCIEMCIASHGVCDPSEEDLVALVDAIEDSDLLAAQEVIKRLENPVHWNEGRRAFQVVSKCSPDVVFHAPVNPEFAAELTSISM